MMREEEWATWLQFEQDGLTGQYLVRRVAYVESTKATGEIWRRQEGR